MPKITIAIIHSAIITTGIMTLAKIKPPKNKA